MIPFLDNSRHFFYADGNKKQQTEGILWGLSWVRPKGKEDTNDKGIALYPPSL